MAVEASIRVRPLRKFPGNNRKFVHGRQEKDRNRPSSSNRPKDYAFMHNRASIAGRSEGHAMPYRLSFRAMVD